ncbi:MAG: hypothetical protein MUE60_15425, partial [Candidatus Eisenbacteria bacterium]|nr:hypothetical protein [Candidatus Eisenbacteria bacterium]
MDPSRIATVWGDEVSIVHAVDDATIICEPGRPVTFTPVAIDQLIHGAVYDLARHALVAPGTYFQPVLEFPSPPVYAEILLDGSLESTGELGEILITGMNTDDDNWWQGDLGQAPGQSIVPRSVIIPRLWSDSDFFANRWIGGMYGVATHPGFLGIWLDESCLTGTTPSGMLRVDRLTYVLESSRTTHAGIADNRIPGFIGARFHALGPGDSLDLGALEVRPLPGDEPPALELRGVFPFPVTTEAEVRFSCPAPGEATLTVWDLGGRLVSRCACLPVAAGATTVTWRATLPSGTYCLALQKGSARATTPIVVTR